MVLQRHQQRARRVRAAVPPELRRRRLRQRRGRPRPRPRHRRHRAPPPASCTSRSTARNLMVKIPATAEGVPAIQQMIAEGRNINVTLIFSLDRYDEVMEAYIAGLEQYADDRRRRPVKVASVGSFFISRVDTEIDQRLDAIGTPEALALRGKAAVAQGKLAYRLFQRDVQRPALGGARGRGRRVQRPLWASTSHQEPGVPRHAVRRRADRPRHRQHAARRDDRGVRRPRHPRPPGRRRRRRGRARVAAARPTSASTSTTSPPSSRREASPASRRASTSSSTHCSRRPTELADLLISPFPPRPTQQS